MSLAIAMFGGTSVPASAQTDDSYRLDRPADATAAIPIVVQLRPGHEPIGGRFGSFFLYPALDVTADHTDNVLGSDVRRRGDGGVSVRVGALLESRWSRHRLAIDGYSLLNRYPADPGQDSSGFGAHLAGRYDIARDTRAEVDVRIDRGPEDRLDVAANASVKPIAIATLASSLRVDKGLGDLTLTGRVQRVASRYADGADAAGASLPQAFRNSDRSIYTGVARYDLRSGVALIAVIAHDDLGYRRPTSLDRDSTGLRIEGGIGLAAGLLTGEVRIGYLRRDNASPALRSPQGLSFYAGAGWTPVPRLSVRLDANRDVEDATSPFAAGNLRSEARVTLDYQLFADVVLSPSLRVASIDPIGIEGTNTETDAEWRATYLIGRRYHLTARVRHVNRSAGQYPPLHATQGFMTVGLTL
ncbi:outer membrane beta-barrel protein [Sphingomonas bacterium]|uniref:outer membrane beta-barrel protein n=1 Tax=Sphingomonas bacterium TaxID=1895847 RepID=UPI0015762F77|nr:outer membrane beta-barrel protein [Sphingomonas bacterium]